jgi:class 3 adenylate cyclase
VKSRGDGFMLAFAGARRGVQCAVAIQRALAAEPIVVDELGVVEVRIGVHTGEALQAEHDLFGRHVNLAARIADQAGGGEVLVSALTRDLLAGADDFTFGAARDVVLKGVSDSQRVVAVEWRTTAASVADDIENEADEEENASHAGTGT